MPLDPGVPAARLGFMLADAAARVAVTTADLAGRFAGFDVVVVDVDEVGVAVQPSGPLPAPGPEDVAYVIYTSGTTGVPKGVAVAHGGVTRLIGSLDERLPQAGVWPLCHSLAFDVSVWEIFGALLRGGRLVVVPESVVASPQEFEALLVEQGVTVLTQTPSAVGMLWGRGWSRRPWWWLVRRARPRWWIGGRGGG